MTATWLCAISCEKVNDTAEQNGHADTTAGRPARSTARTATRSQRSDTNRGLGFMKRF